MIVFAHQECCWFQSTPSFPNWTLLQTVTVAHKGTHWLCCLFACSEKVKSKTSCGAKWGKKNIWKHFSIYASISETFPNRHLFSLTLCCKSFCSETFLKFWESKIEKALWLLFSVCLFVVFPQSMTSYPRLCNTVAERLPELRSQHAAPLVSWSVFVQLLRRHPQLQNREAEVLSQAAHYLHDNGRVRLFIDCVRNDCLIWTALSHLWRFTFHSYFKQFPLEEILMDYISRHESTSEAM